MGSGAGGHQLIDTIVGVDPQPASVVVVELLAARERLEARACEALSGFLARGLHQVEGWSSPVGWLKAQGLSDADAKRLAVRSARLTAWPTLGSLWFDGKLSVAQVETVVRLIPKGLVDLYAAHDGEISPLLVGLSVVNTTRAVHHWVTRAEAIANTGPTGDPGSDGGGSRVHLSRTLDGRGILDADLERFLAARPVGIFEEGLFRDALAHAAGTPTTHRAPEAWPRCSPTAPSCIGCSSPTGRSSTAGERCAWRHPTCVTPWSYATTDAGSRTATPPPPGSTPTTSNTGRRAEPLISPTSPGSAPPTTASSTATDGTSTCNPTAPSCSPDPTAPCSPAHPPDCGDDQRCRCTTPTRVASSPSSPTPRPRVAAPTTPRPRPSASTLDPMGPDSATSRRHAGFGTELSISSAASDEHHHRRRRICSSGSQPADPLVGHRLRIA